MSALAASVPPGGGLETTCRADWLPTSSKRGSSVSRARPATGPTNCAAMGWSGGREPQRGTEYDPSGPVE